MSDNKFKNYCKVIRKYIKDDTEVKVNDIHKLFGITPHIVFRFFEHTDTDIIVDRSKKCKSVYGRYLLKLIDKIESNPIRNNKDGSWLTAEQCFDRYRFGKVLMTKLAKRGLVACEGIYERRYDMDSLEPCYIVLRHLLIGDKNVVKAKQYEDKQSIGIPQSVIRLNDDGTIDTSKMANEAVQQLTKYEWLSCLGLDEDDYNRVYKMLVPELSQEGTAELTDAFVYNKSTHKFEMSKHFENESNQLVWFVCAICHTPIQSHIDRLDDENFVCEKCKQVHHNGCKETDIRILRARNIFIKQIVKEHYNTIEKTILQT